VGAVILHIGSDRGLSGDQPTGFDTAVCDADSIYRLASACPCHDSDFRRDRRPHAGCKSTRPAEEETRKRRARRRFDRIRCRGNANPVASRGSKRNGSATDCRLRKQLGNAITSRGSKRNGNTADCRLRKQLGNAIASRGDKRNGNTAGRRLRK